MSRGQKASCSPLKDGKFQTSLPLRNNKELKLPINRLMTRKRCMRNRKSFQEYSDQMVDLRCKAYAEGVPEFNRVNDGMKWYLPHHSVNHSRKPGKLPIVFGLLAVFGFGLLAYFDLNAYVRGKSDTTYHYMRQGSLYNLTEDEHVLKLVQECVFSSDKIELLAGHLRKGIGVISLDPAIHDNLLWCRRLQNQDMDPSAKHPILLLTEGKAVHEKVRDGCRQHVLSDLVRSATVERNGNKAAGQQGCSRGFIRTNLNPSRGFKAGSVKATAH